MVKEMVSIQTEENAGTLQVSFFRDVHAPVEIFIRDIIQNHGHEETPEDGTLCQILHHEHEWNVKHPHDGSIPPSHGHGVLILGFLKMIRVVGLEDSMMGHRMGFEWIGEPLQIGVHHVLVKSPLEEAAVHHAAEETYGLPEEEVAHKQFS